MFKHIHLRINNNAQWNHILFIFRFTIPFRFMSYLFKFICIDKYFPRTYHLSINDSLILNFGWTWFEFHYIISICIIQQLTEMRENVLYAIFLNMLKVYDVSERDRCMEILKVFGVGTQACCVLRAYLYRLSMVVCVGVYYRAVLQGFWGGEPGRAALPHHFHCGDGLSGASLYLVGGGRCGRAGRVRKGGASPRRPFIHGWQHGRISWSVLDAGFIQHPHRVVRQGGDPDKHLEDSQGALLYLPCGWYLVGAGLWAVGDRGVLIYWACQQIQVQWPYSRVDLEAGLLELH